MLGRWCVLGLLVLFAGRGARDANAQTIREFLSLAPAEQDATIGQVAVSIITFMKSKGHSCDKGGWDTVTKTYIEEKEKHFSDDDIDFCMVLAMYTPDDHETPIGYALVKEEAARAKDPTQPIGMIVQQAAVEKTNLLFRNALNVDWLRSDPRYASYYIDYFRTLLEPHIQPGALPAAMFLKLHAYKQDAIVEHAMENIARHLAEKAGQTEAEAENSRRIVEYARVFFLLASSKRGKPFGYNLVLSQAEKHTGEMMSAILNRTMNELDGDYGRFLIGVTEEKERILVLRVVADGTLINNPTYEDEPVQRLETAREIAEILPAYAATLPAPEQKLFKNVAVVLLQVEKGRIGRSLADHANIHRAESEARPPLATLLVRSALDSFGRLRTDAALLIMGDAEQQERIRADAEARVVAIRRADDKLVLEMMMNGKGNGYARLKGRVEKDGKFESRMNLVGAEFCYLTPAGNLMTLGCNVYSGPDRQRAAIRMNELEADVTELFPTWSSLVRQVSRTDPTENAHLHQGPGGQLETSGIEPDKDDGYALDFSLTLQ